MEQTGNPALYEYLGRILPPATGIRPGGLEVTERALSFCRFTEGSTLIDIGSGTGVTLTYLTRVHRLSAIGVDSSTEQLREARRRDPSISLISAHAMRLPFDNGRFDGVFLECVLSLTPDQPGTLAECNRILKPGGRLILSDVYARNPLGVASLRNLAVHCCLHGATDISTLTGQVESAGFEVELLEDHSDRLREFTFRMVWRFGSMARFWSLAGGRQRDSEKTAEAIRTSRPGYYLLVGRKNAHRKPDESRP